MQSERLKCCKNAIRIFRMQFECGWNALQMLFDICPLGMQFESFDHEQNIPAAQKNGPEYLEIGMQLIVLECILNIQEWTKIFIPTRKKVWRKGIPHFTSL